MNIIESIKNYILFLITDCGLFVTLHPHEKEELVTLSELSLYNIHHNSYCTHIKTLPDGQKRCIAQQKKVFAHCCDTANSFCGVCHAGVFEYVYPLTDGKTVLGFISVGGYAIKQPQQHLENTAARFGVNIEQLKNTYKTLKAVTPSKKYIDTLITPLCNMLELAYIKTKASQTNSGRLIDCIIQYIRQNYDTNLSIESLCKKFGCSRSYISHAFSVAAGKNFKDYLLELRLQHAKRLLEISTLNVTEIAFSVGFNNSNYFSTAFKKFEGKSPLEYRKLIKQK